MTGPAIGTSRGKIMLLLRWRFDETLRIRLLLIVALLWGRRHGGDIRFLLFLLAVWIFLLQNPDP